MDISGVTSTARSIGEMGDLLKNMAAEKQDFSHKMISLSATEKVQDAKLGNLVDLTA